MHAGSALIVDGALCGGCEDGEECCVLNDLGDIVQECVRVEVDEGEEFGDEATALADPLGAIGSYGPSWMG